MTSTFNCIHCGESVPAAVSQIGLMTLCPRCHAEVTIPAHGPEPDGPTLAPVILHDDEVDEMEDMPQYQRFIEAWLGPNMRVTDNLIQGVFTLLCVLAASVWGYYFENRSFAGALHGIIGGLIVGFLVGGFLLTVFRLIKDE